MKKFFKTAISIWCSFILAFAGVFVAFADNNSHPKYNNYLQQVLDNIYDNDFVPINVIAFLRIGSDEIKAVQEDYALCFIEEADRLSYFERLDTDMTMRYEDERSFEEMLNYLKTKDEEFYKRAAASLEISEEDIVFTGEIDWFNDVSKWNVDNNGSMCLKNLNKIKFLELNDSDLVSEFFGETEGKVENFGNDTGTKEDNNTNDTFTYYFLAPEFWIDTTQGAENENVGVLQIKVKT